jgi:tRNA pseudouridine55 synthase
MIAMDGVLILDKPAGISSHDAVRRIRRLADTKRVGHLGTLDPLATGVLPLVLGRATRLAQFFSHHDRAYEAVFRFGFATDSYDRDGVTVGARCEVTLDRAELEAIMPDYRGKIEQTPPPISAKKIDGVPAYKLVRKNKPVNLEPVQVEIYEFTLLEVDGPRASVSIRCSPGTYVRSLAHDIGQRLGVGAHVETLRRTATGDFDISMANTLEELSALREQGRFEEALIPPDRLLPEFPNQRVDAITAARIVQGRDFRVSPFGVQQGTKLVKAIDPDGRLVAIGEARMPLIYHPIVVL